MATADGDTPMNDAPAKAGPPGGPDAADTLVLSEDEKRVLALYDRLRTLQLEIALLRARQSYNGSETDVPSLADAQKQLLDARAAYVLRNEVIDSVLSVNPILKAVHRATHASPIERDLLPAVEQRDAVSQTVARQATARQAVQDERIAVAAESRRIARQNAALASEARALVAARDTETGQGDAADDGGAGAREKEALAKLEADVKASRQRWKLIKGAASAIVVGSGVDWARDASLQDIVLDPE